jgi:hypothetical protein
MIKPPLRKVHSLQLPLASFLLIRNNCLVVFISDGPHHTSAGQSLISRARRAVRGGANTP